MYQPSAPCRPPRMNSTPPRMAVELGHADAVAPVPRIERTTAFEDALDKALRRMADFLDVPLGEVRWRA